MKDDGTCIDTLRSVLNASYLGDIANPVCSVDHVAYLN